MEVCAFPGCGRKNTVQCAYVDRRDRECGYWWCPEHRVEVDGHPYCRRHSGVMRAILAQPYDTMPPPDLDNRALSLCEWVSADLDDDLRKMLDSLPREGEGWVTAHPLSLVLQRALGVRAWGRTWTLANQTGSLRKIGIHVDENEDSVVIATVDGNEVVRAVPPWITTRGAGVSEDAVAGRRAKFRADVLEAITAAATESGTSPSYIKEQQPT